MLDNPFAVCYCIVMVREAEYFYDLSPVDRLRVRFVVDHGDIVDFVVQLESLAGDRFRPVIRYDGSHGLGHADILDWNGDTIDKQWLPSHMTLADCLNHAERDLRLHWERYRHRFMERRGHEIS